MSKSETKVFDPSVHHGYSELEDISETVRARYGTGGNNTPFVVNERKECTALSVGNGQLNQISMSGTANALDTMHDQQCVMTYQALGVDTQGNAASTERARDDLTTSDLVCSNTKQLTVRRLTPLECTRLQGYPDDWLDVPGISDSQKYKMLGNSIALPFWEHLAKRFAQYGGVRTIGSLFDGISGFPLVFKRAGCETLWTSEIDPHCQKVTTYHTERGDL